MEAILELVFCEARQSSLSRAGTGTRKMSFVVRVMFYFRDSTHVGMY